ncbi:MAG TPA: cytochrome c-type biogenesis protein [Solirubrobacterales bacterium]|nr:cytochrome c-type biogenesis protein [Solirubrobacterales bacterium]
MRRAATLFALAVGLLVFAAPALAAPTRQTTVHDIEDEVMCPICGTLLELADSPQAKREKVYVAKLIAAGKTKAEIKDALVAQYGSSVLALPKASGFDLSAYLVPILAFAIAVIALAFSVSRWRRDGRHPPADEDAPAAPPQDEDAERLDADLGRYDL